MINIFDKLKNPALAGLIKDQRVRELITRREFRVSDDYLQREFIGQAGDDELRELSIRFFEGHGELRGVVKKRLLPAISFSTRFTLHGVEFNSMGKRLHLAIEQVKPLDLEWVTRRIVERVPFLAYNDGLVTCDLTRVPRLRDLLAYELKGMQLANFVTLREIGFQDGALVGRIALCL